MCFFFYSVYALMFLLTNCKNDVLKGIIKEAALVLDFLSRTDCDLFFQYNICNAIRKYTVPVLTKLEEEFACETDAANDTSEKPMGYCLNNLISLYLMRILLHRFLLTFDSLQSVGSVISI